MAILWAANLGKRQGPKLLQQKGRGATACQDEQIQIALPLPCSMGGRGFPPPSLSVAQT